MNQLKRFFELIETPNTIIQIGEANSVSHNIKYGADFDYEAFINNNLDKNLYFLAGIKEEVTTRAKDVDMACRSYIGLDFDVRSHEEKINNATCDNEQLKKKILEIKTRLDNSVKFKDYFALVFSGNGLHAYFRGTPIVIDDVEVFRAGMEELVKEISEIIDYPADSQCVNAARIMRLPESINNKKEPVRTAIIELREFAESKLLDVLMETGKNAIENRKQLAKMQVNTIPTSITTNTLDAYEAINQISIGELICSIFGWEKDGGHHFRAPGDTKRKACFIASDGNYIIHGGTDHFSDAQSGYNPFQFVKTYYELNNKATFQWFRDKYPQIKELPNKAEEENKGPEESKATLLIEIVNKAGIKLFTDQFNEPWASITGDGTKIMMVDSKPFEKLLFGLAMDKGLIVGSETVKTAKAILSYRAEINNDKRKLFVRTAQLGNEFWYDLGEKAVKITKEGWSIENPPILFKRFSHQQNQVIPERNGSINDFMDMVNIERESDKLLLAIYLVGSFIPNFPHPVLVLYGCQGSAKSSTFRMLKELIDPSSLSTLSISKDIPQFIQTVSHHWASLFDNCSRISGELSDAICRVVTGEGASKRKLYSDDDDVIYNLQHVIGINGIASVINRPDLLDRSLLIEMAVIDESNRKDEAALRKRFDEIKPGVLGACFDAVSKAMAIKDDVNISWLPRMADFAKWGYAIAEAIGVNGDTFIEAYKANINQQADEIINSNPISAAVIALVEEGSYTDTPARTLSKLKEVADLIGLDYVHDQSWPRDPNWLIRRLRELAPSLNKIGIVVSNGKSGGSRLVTIEKKQSPINEARPLQDSMDGTDSISPETDDYVQEVLNMF